MKRDTRADSRPKSYQPLTIGQAVEITRGQMRRLSGCVVRFGRRGNCLIELNGVQKGILLSISLTSVRPIRVNGKAKSSGVGEPPLEWTSN
jgi:hypothetical protein